jgi:nucleotide-binding universal stress UspA family protein
MQRFKNILLVHEPGARGRKARSRAIDLALRNSAQVKLVEVAEPLPSADSTYKTSEGEISLQDLVTREHEAALENVAHSMREAGVWVSVKVLTGTPFLAILKEVHEAQHDLVMLTTEGDGGLKDHLFGSTSRHLLRKCSVPVWVVRPARKRKKFRVLAAVNPAEKHRSAENLNRTILEMASSLTRMYDGALDIVHVWQPAPKSGRVSRKVIASWNSDLFLAAEQRLTDLLDGFDFSDLSPRIHLPSGPTGLRISEVAEQRRSDIIVMGTLSRSGLRGLFMGNTCETVLQHIDASVLAVKPAGFKSPVKFGR